MIKREYRCFYEGQQEEMYFDHCKETRILYSNLNFDLWLLLHKTQYMKNAQSNDAYISSIRKEYNLSNIANIKNKATIQKMLEQIKIEDIKKAVKNANEIMDNKLEKDKIYVKKIFRIILIHQ